MKRIASIKRIGLTGTIALTLSAVTTPTATAAELALSDVPLFIDLAVEPNIVLTIDDSGSMEGCDMKQKGISSSRVENKKGMTASAVNQLAYDPNVQYVVPIDGNGGSLGTPSFTAAWIDGYNKTAGTRDLSNNFLPCWDDLTDWRITPLPAQAAYYHDFTGDPNNNSDSGTGVGNQANYTKVVIGPAEEQNFAIWFSYYRNRLLAMKSAAGRAFADPTLGGRVRIAQQTMWGYNGSKSTKTNISLMKLFGKENDLDAVAKQNRVDFFTWLHALQNTGGTPLPYSMWKAGEYYRDIENVDGVPSNITPVNSPWAAIPGKQELPRHSCRQAFHVMMTDGEWYDSIIQSYAMHGDVDGLSTTLPDSTPYNPFPPYDDSNPSSSLDPSYIGDVAFYYWATDLQPGLADNVPKFMPDPTPHPTTLKVEDNPKNDPATWQHMVNFTVGFGVNGTLDPTDTTTYNNLLNGTQAWGSNRVDDLWHGAINSRGQYISAQNPDDLVNAFATALNAVVARTSSGASVALNSTSLDTDTRVYQARFNSGDWTGQLLAFDIDENTGQVATTEDWDAAVELTNQVSGSGWDNNRRVITFDGSSGIPFRWANLTAGMQADLNKDALGVPDGQGQARLEYLRGSEADEGTSGNKYRARASKLGDIINSAPAYVGDPPFDYPNTLEAGCSTGGEAACYKQFKASTSRSAMVYAGANDGMLHGFDALTGEERIAYVPKAVFPKLSRLTASNYDHRFFVDGPPTVADAFWGGSWHSVLVAGLRKGGQAIYALDVTNPTAFNDENTAKNSVLWEFTDADDKDLGYTFSQPAIVRMNNGDWAAVFGNGYNNTENDGNASATGNAVLYIVNLESGNLIKKIDTLAGTATTPNGLATVLPVDVDGNHIVDYVYGGDLLGNVWKFDVRDTNSSSWGVAYKLFTATDAGGTPQPITTRLEVGLHPEFKTGSDFYSNGGYVVYFGTGKYLENTDNVTTGTQTQTFYGIWDPDKSSGPPTYSRATNLLQQQITDERQVTVNGVDADIRISTDNTITWAADPLFPGAGEHIGWYMDLENINASPPGNGGERQITYPILRGGRIIFTTLIPSGSSCVFGGDGWLMELDAADGSRLSDPPFDIDGDGVFDLVNDGSGNMVPPSGIKSAVGAPSAPAIVAGDGIEYKVWSGTDQGAIQSQGEQPPPPPPTSATRESWQQLR